MGHRIRETTGKARLTFRELHERVGEPGFRDLYVISTNLSKQVAQTFSYEDTPDVTIAYAVRMSMSIPLYFRSIRRNRHVMVDGGVTRNYPLNIFDHTDFLVNPANGETVDYNTSPGYVFNHETLGFRLDSKDEIAYNEQGWSNVPRSIHSIADYAKTLMGFMMESANKSHLHGNDWNRTVFIDTLGVKTTDFNLSRKKIKDLVESGKEGAEKYFEWRNSQ